MWELLLSWVTTEAVTICDRHVFLILTHLELCLMLRQQRYLFSLSKEVIPRSCHPCLLSSS